MMILAIGCAAVHQDRAQQYFGAGQYDKAGYEIQAALTHDPGNLKLRHLAAKIFTQQGYQRYKRGEMISASQYFNKAIDYDPTYAPAYDYLGILAFAQGNWESAISNGSAAAGYSGQPESGYVQQARRQLKRIRSGRMRFRTQTTH
ncbi:MAG: tetratricopeptide repeat protein [Candidatus Binataceae bacterium]